MLGVISRDYVVGHNNYCNYFDPVAIDKYII